MLVPTQQILKGGSSPSQAVGDDGERTQTAQDRERLDVGRKALKELLRSREQQKKQKRSCSGIVRLNCTVCGGLMLILALMNFMFLVPMTIDPALATLTFELTHDPVICMTTSFTVTEGLINTTWCSCLEGCTSDVFTCYQIGVSYQKISANTKQPILRKRSIHLQPKVQGETALINTKKRQQLVTINNPENNTENIRQLNQKSTFKEHSDKKIRRKKSVNLPLMNNWDISENSPAPDLTFSDYVPPSEESPESNENGYVVEDFSNYISDVPENFDDNIGRERFKRSSYYKSENWDVANASLFVNIKGCGYPPDVNCSLFESKYSTLGRRYFCHYSQLNNSIVLDSYDRSRAIVDLYYSFGFTFGAILLGAFLILIMNFPYKKAFRRIKKRKIAQAPRY